MVGSGRTGKQGRMRLTLYTDYSLRLLMYLAAKPGSATISEVADHYGISRNHMVRIVHDLGKKGWIHTERGRGGGLTLAKPASAISIGAVVRDTEPDFHLVECFDPEKNACVITRCCKLQQALWQAKEAFLNTLDNYTLADMARMGDAILDPGKK